MPGTEQKLFLLANSVTSDHANKNLEHAGQASPAGKIIRPTTGTIFALDPDIPPDHQMLQMATQQVGAQWWINRKRVIGLTNPQRWYWAPSPGKFQIELRSAQGQVLDQVAIEVRGAEWKTNQ